MAYLLGWSSVLTVKSVEIIGTTAQPAILAQFENDEVLPQVGQKLSKSRSKSN